MENKKTTELLDLLSKLTDDDYKTDGKYEKIMGELETRDPFVQIIGKDWDTSLPALLEKIEDLEAEIKKLKRHKHEAQTGDVMVRI